MTLEPINLRELRAYAERDLPDWSTNPYENEVVLALIDVAQAARETLIELQEAEQAAQIQERQGNEGDADAIRRSAMTSILGSKHALFLMTPLKSALARFSE